MRRSLLILVVALVLGGCGGGERKPFSYDAEFAESDFVAGCVEGAGNGDFCRGLFRCLKDNVPAPTVERLVGRVRRGDAQALLEPKLGKAGDLCVLRINARYPEVGGGYANPALKLAITTACRQNASGVPDVEAACDRYFACLRERIPIAELRRYLLQAELERLEPLVRR